MSFMKPVAAIALSFGLLFAAGAAKATSHKEAPNMAADCDKQAAEKKLAGAAKTSCVKKCSGGAMAAKTPAAEACDMKAAEKKLAGAAKNSFTKKCLADAK